MPSDACLGKRFTRSSQLVRASMVRVSEAAQGPPNEGTGRATPPTNGGSVRLATVATGSHGDRLPNLQISDEQLQGEPGAEAGNIDDSSS